MTVGRKTRCTSCALIVTGYGRWTSKIKQNVKQEEKLMPKRKRAASALVDENPDEESGTASQVVSHLSLFSLFVLLVLTRLTTLAFWGPD